MAPDAANRGRPRASTSGPQDLGRNGADSLWQNEKNKNKVMSLKTDQRPDVPPSVRQCEAGPLGARGGAGAARAHTMGTSRNHCGNREGKSRILMRMRLLSIDDSFSEAKGRPASAYV